MITFDGIFVSEKLPQGPDLLMSALLLLIQNQKFVILSVPTAVSVLTDLVPALLAGLVLPVIKQVVLLHVKMVANV